MAAKRSQSVTRKPRSDAQRNRKRILEVAKAEFTRRGAQASLDDIVREAGVGPGTLYRHFPTRDALIEAVYQSEVEKLALAARELSETKAPIDALRSWMLLFVEHIATKKIIAPVLNSLVDGPCKLFQTARSQMEVSVGAMVKRAVKSGDLRKDIHPFDLILPVIGVANIASGPDWQQSARRLVDILIAGSRP